ncbi:hypothetical protein GCM10027062_15830 [Nocardioides hungaricus]
MSDTRQDQEQQYDRWSRPDALSRRGYVIVALVPFVIAAIGFGIVSLVSAGDETGSGTSVRLPVSGWAGDIADGAALEGVLQVDDRQCVYLDTGGSQVFLVWPAGYSATLDQGRLALRDSNGNLVAQDGNQVRVGGGSIPAGTFSSEPCLPDSGDVFAVQSKVTVLQ